MAGSEIGLKHLIIISQMVANTLSKIAFSVVGMIQMFL